jgi:hypothetical protein
LRPADLLMIKLIVLSIGKKKENEKESFAVK